MSQINNLTSSSQFTLDLEGLVSSLAGSVSSQCLSGLCPDLRREARSSLTDESVSLEQAETLIETLWSLALAMVDLAYRSTPADQAQAARNKDRAPCGKLSAKSPAECDKPALEMLISSNPETEQTEWARKASSFPFGKVES